MNEYYIKKTLGFKIWFPIYKKGMWGISRKFLEFINISRTAIVECCKTIFPIKMYSEFSTNDKGN